MFDNELKVIENAEKIQKYGNAPIRMKSKYIFNMVDTSLGLGLYPADEDEYQRLMNLYSVFDTVKKSDYRFTPHITLAYYSIDGFDLQAARHLEDIVSQLNSNEMDIELNMHYLYYQKFRSMNDYIDIIPLAAYQSTR
ncbi:MAG: hypothetical protein K2P59_06865 [Acetatifactor sp.]|nr:hypothetical protein [Acetatifactor sp.]